MSMLVAIFILCIVLFFNLAVNGLLLWLACRWCRATRLPATKPTAAQTPDPRTVSETPRITYRRCLATALLAALLNLAATGVFWSVRFTEHPLRFLAAQILTHVAILVVGIHLMLRPSLSKSISVGLVWAGLTAGYAFVFVLLVHGFVAQAFIIPTGAMAETIWGYHKLVICPQCGHEFTVNCSCEGDPQQGMAPIPVMGCICPNCRYSLDFQRDRVDPPCEGGDRVLVYKGILDRLFPPNRLDAVAFHYPDLSQGTGIIYLKRLVGLPKETIAIWNGKLYVTEGLSYDDSQVAARDLWKSQYMHGNEADAVRLFQAGKFRIIRKSPREVLASRRLVFDNDHHAKDLVGKVPPRWSMLGPAGAWIPDQSEQPRVFRHPARQAGGLAWLRYQHNLPNLERSAGKRQLITDFQGYNTWQIDRGFHALPPENWVGDLILECVVTVEKPEGEFLLELAKGSDRFRAQWDLETGMCALFRLSNGQEEKLSSTNTEVKRPGTYRLRFANVDERLTVWLENRPLFGDGVAYAPPAEPGPRAENDLEPASMGVRAGAVTIAHVQLWRDTYYTANLRRVPDSGGAIDYGEQADWEPLRKRPVRTFYVQPGHYLFLGDNSPESADSRSWGVVPERFLLGKALLVYYPISRAGILP